MASDEDLSPRVNDLEAMAERAGKFSGLREVERRLLRGAPNGELVICGPSDDPKDPTNDPAKADSWGQEREIRSALIRWLCCNGEAASRVDPRGLQLIGGKITGSLDLAFVNVQFRLALLRCRFTGDVEADRRAYSRFVS